MVMSAILDRSVYRTESHLTLDVPELEPESVFGDEPRLKLATTRELERLKPLLEHYNPHTQPLKYYKPPRDYGMLVAKLIGYSVLVGITLFIGLMIIAPFLPLGC